MGYTELEKLKDKLAAINVILDCINESTEELLAVQQSSVIQHKDARIRSILDVINRLSKLLLKYSDDEN